MMGDINQRFPTARMKFPQGPSLPISPLLNELFYDSNPTINQHCYWDGTRWLGTSIMIASGSPVNSLPPIAATTANVMRWPVQANQDILITGLKISTVVASTNNGSNFWTVTLSKTTAAQVDTTMTGGTFTTVGDFVGSWANHDLPIGEVVSASSFKVITLKVAATGSPGSLNFTPLLLYRLVIPAS